MYCELYSHCCGLNLFQKINSECSTLFSVWTSDSDTEDLEMQRITERLKRVFQLKYYNKFFGKLFLFLSFVYIDFGPKYLACQMIPIWSTNFTSDKHKLSLSV